MLAALRNAARVDRPRRWATCGSSCPAPARPASPSPRSCWRPASATIAVADSKGVLHAGRDGPDRRSSARWPRHDQPARPHRHARRRAGRRRRLHRRLRRHRRRGGRRLDGPGRDRLRAGQPGPRDPPESPRGTRAVVATGRSDFPNQINNVLAFPGVFRGALDVRRHRDHRGHEARRGRRAGRRRRRRPGRGRRRAQPRSTRGSRPRSPRGRRGRRAPRASPAPVSADSRSTASVGSRACSPSPPPASVPTTRWPGSTSASGPSPTCPTAGRRSRCAPRPQPPRPVDAARASASRADRLPIVLGCDGAGRRRGRQRGRRPRRDRRPRRRRRRRDARPAALAALRGPRRHARRAGRRAAPQPGAQAGRAVVRGGRLPAAPRGSPRTGCSSPAAACSPAARCWSRARAAASRPRRSCSAGPPGFRVYATSRDEAKRARALELGADAVVRARRAAARAGRRRDRDRRRGDLVHSLKSLRPGGTIVVAGATSGAAPPADLARVFFTAAAGRRLDDGHARRARAAARPVRHARASGRSSTACCR